MIFVHSFKEIGLFPFNLNESVVGVTPSKDAMQDCVILHLAISASKFGNTFSPLFLDFRDYILKYIRIFVNVNTKFSIFRDLLLFCHIFILIFRDFGVIINLVR